MKRPILFIAIFFSAGIITGRLFNLPISIAAVLTFIFLATAVLFSNNEKISHSSLYLAIFFLGFAAYLNSISLPADHISSFVSQCPKRVFVKGVIADDPVKSTTFYKKKKTSFLLEANCIKDFGTWKEANGLIRVDVYSRAGLDFNFGEEAVLEGLISKPFCLKNPGIFDYSAYLADNDIYSVLKVREGFRITVAKKAHVSVVKRIAYALRRNVINLIDIYFEGPYSGFLKAILVNDRSALDKNITSDFIKTGTVHIIAISGLHVVMIAGIMLAILGALKIPRRIGLVWTVLFLIIYSAACGSSPPIVRAVLTFTVFIGSYILDRDNDALNSLACAGLFMLICNPKELFDPGFQLSFISVASLILIAPKIDKILAIEYIAKGKVTSKIRAYILKSVSVSFSAWLGTWPIIAWYFNIISPVSLIANLLVIPMSFLLMIISFIFLAAGQIPNVASDLLAQLLYVIEKSIFFVSQVFAGLPFACFNIGAPSVGFLAVYYSALSLLLWPKRYSVMIVLLAFNLMAWSQAPYFGKAGASITFLDVGQGDSALIELPQDRRILVDGGSGPNVGKQDMGKSVVMPYLLNKGVRVIDAVVVSHFHEDHLGGVIDVLKNFKIGCVMDSGVDLAGNKIYDEYIKTLKEKNIRRFAIGEGDQIKGFDGVEFFVLHPEKDKDPEDASLDSENGNSIVLKFVFGNLSALFCGDITDEAMGRISDRYGRFLNSDILKVPHHGGCFDRINAVKKFLKSVSCDAAIISGGERGGGRGSISKPMFNTITSFNSICYETGRFGAITVSKNSRILKITPFRNKN